VVKLYPRIQVASCIAIALTSIAASEPTILVPPESAQIREGYRLLGRVWVRPTGRFQFSQILKADINQSRLQILIEPDDAWKPRLINARRVIAEADRDQSLWWMMFTQTTQLVPPAQRGATMVMMPAADSGPATNAALQLSGVTVAPGGVILRGTGMVDALYVNVEYRADAQGRSPRLTIADANNKGFDFVGEDLVDLLAKDAAVVRAYLSPLLRELSGRDLLMPRAADVYRAFQEIEPSPEEERRFAELLRELASDVASVRAAASDQLRNSGTGMVLVAVRTDLSRLPPGLATQVLILLEENSFGETSAEKLRADYQWLRALDTFPDRRVRDLSRELLAEFVD